MSYQSSRGNNGEEVLVRMILAKNSGKIKRYKRAQQALRRLICLKYLFPHPCLQKPIVRLSANLLALSIFCLEFQIHFLASSCFVTFYGTENHREYKCCNFPAESIHTALCQGEQEQLIIITKDQNIVSWASVLLGRLHLGFISVSKMQHPWSCDVVLEG